VASKTPPKAATGSQAKTPDNAKTPEPKNAASTNALALSTVPDRQPDIALKLSAVEGTRFEVPFAGTGWTYLGEKNAKEGIGYDSRRFVGSSLVFVLNPIKVGDYLLRFQRQDSLRGISYEELVAVSVAPKPAGTAPGTVPAVTTASTATPILSAGAAATAAVPSVQPTATEAIPSVPPAATAAIPSVPPAATAAAPSVQTAIIAAAAGTAAPTTTAAAAGSAAAIPALSVASLATPEAALAQARSELAAGRAQGALDALDRLIVLAPDGTDEALLLYGQALERNGPQKDIKRAYAYYKKLRDDYPESAFWDKADERVSYIERHYFDIR
jgi:hypothetical protein